MHRTRRRALVALCLLLPVPSIGVLFGMRLAPGLVGQIIYGVSKAWIALLPAVWHLAVERDRLSLSPLRRGGLGAGLLLGALIGIIVVAAYLVFGPMWIDADHVRSAARTNGIGTRPAYLLLCGYLILVNSLLEEYVWRWFVFRRLEELAGGAWAVLGSALGFTAHHVIALDVQFPWRVTALASLGVFIGGVAWSWCYLRYRSIWPGYVSHVVVDVAVLAIGWRLIFGA